MSDIRSRFAQAFEGGRRWWSPRSFTIACRRGARPRRQGIQGDLYDRLWHRGPAPRGFPDLGLLTMGEMVDNVQGRWRGRWTSRSSATPTRAMASRFNVQRTVREYEDAGAAALHIEDQVWPKRLRPFFERANQVIPLENMEAKAAARRLTPGAQIPT